MSRRAERAGHLAPNRLRVVPPPHRGAADLGVVAVILTAAVEQAEQVVGGQWPVSGIERARFGRRHRGQDAGLGGRAVAGQVRCQPEPGPEAARRQAGRVRRHLPAEPAPPGGILRIPDGAAARGRREPGRVIRFRRAHRHGRQLEEGEQLALERLLAAEQDAGLGVHDQLDAVAGGRAQARPGPHGTVPRHGRHGDRLAAAGGDRAAHVQGEPGEQAGRAEQGRNRQPRDVLEAARRERRRVRRPERPGLLAVRSVGAATMVALVLQAVPPAGRDQQGRVPPVIDVPLGVRLLLHVRHAGRSGAEPHPPHRLRPDRVLPAAGQVTVLFEAHLGGQGQAGPVGPVEQPDYFWQASHDAPSEASRWREAGTPARLVKLCPVPARDPHGLW